MELRPYQAEALANIRKELAAGRDTVAVLPTGAGKTVLFSEAIRTEPGASVAIAHRQELVTQISLALARDGVEHRIVGPKSVVKLAVRTHREELGRDYINPTAQCAAIGVDTLLRRAERPEVAQWLRSVRLVVMDECFPAGTLVDGRPIEQLRVGDTVTAYDARTGQITARPVVRVFKRIAPERMVRVHYANRTTWCTPNHPFLTQRGWINAEKLTRGDSLHYVRSARRYEQSAPAQATSGDGPGVLLARMRQRLSAARKLQNNGADKPQVRVCPDDRAQPNAQRGEPGENARDAKGYRAQAAHTRGQRRANARARAATARRVWSAGVHGADSGENWAETWLRLPPVLQDRLRKRGAKARYRGGRPRPRLTRAASQGPQAGRAAAVVGVDRVTVYERGDYERLGRGPWPDFVYNLEVSGVHTYTADGLIVHNCHHVLRGNKWGKALELFTNARTLGVTATPTRADGKGLGAHADGVFNSMVVGPSMRQLIDAGYLTDYRIFCPPSDLDRASLATGSTGDFTASSMATAVRRSHITGDVVEHYLRIARGKLGVTFVPNVETAHEVADRFNAAGVPAAALSAKTPDSERVATLGKFRRRELLQLVNVDLFGEGFDLPAIEVCSMARPTQSYSLYVQQFGRALRLMDGKHEAVIIDHVGNVVHHGLPDAPREWTLDAREKRSSGPSDAIPLRACVACFLPYERSKPECPMCGHRPEPAERSGPEHVDGDLFELDPEVLARMRGEVEKVDGAPQVAHIPLIGQKAAYKRHIERQHGQAVLREVMAHWAGAERAAGRSDAEILRRFYLRFGVDMMTAKTLKPKEAGALAARIVNGN